jgi:hypothetical protein
MEGNGGRGGLMGKREERREKKGGKEEAREERVSKGVERGGGGERKQWCGERQQEGPEWPATSAGMRTADSGQQIANSK